MFINNKKVSAVKTAFFRNLVVALALFDFVVFFLYSHTIGFRPNSRIKFHRANGHLSLCWQFSRGDGNVDCRLGVGQ